MSRYLAIGDIHGCSIALNTLLNFIELRDDDIIITLGDYVDRGPDSRAVIDLVLDLDRNYQLQPLCGNHEVMLLDARARASWLRLWLENGGDAIPHPTNPEKSWCVATRRNRQEFHKGMIIPYVSIPGFTGKAG